MITKSNRFPVNASFQWLSGQGCQGSVLGMVHLELYSCGDLSVQRHSWKMIGQSAHSRCDGKSSPRSQDAAWEGTQGTGKPHKVTTGGNPKNEDIFTSSRKWG